MVKGFHHGDTEPRRKSGFSRDFVDAFSVSSLPETADFLCLIGFVAFSVPPCLRGEKVLSSHSQSPDQIARTLSQNCRAALPK